MLIFSLFFWLISCLNGFCLPEPEKVVSGDAQFNYPDTNTLQVNALDKTIIDYRSFSIAENESVFLNLPQAADQVLNRVIGSAPSSILGKLFCNGTLFLINPNGINIGPAAVVEAGSLIASTRDITDSDFLSSKYIFGKLPQDQIDRAMILNRGKINIRSAGFGVFISGAIDNQGTITCPSGHIALASGEMVSLGIVDFGLISVAVNQAQASQILDQNNQPITSQIKNTGKIQADGGTITIKAESVTGIFRSAINLEGCVQANKLEEKNGKIFIASSGDVRIAGELNANTIAVGIPQEAVPENVILEASAQLTSQEGGITILAEENISTEAKVFANNGDITFGADQDNNGTGSFKQITGSIETTGNGNIRINGSGEMALGEIRTELGTIRINDLLPAPIITTLPSFVHTKGDLEIVSQETFDTTVALETSRGDKLYYDQAKGVGLQAQDRINTSPAVIFKAAQVSLTARYFGTNEQPLNIIADQITINRAEGAIEILESLGLGTSIMLRGPPEGFGAITYNFNTRLILRAEKTTLSGESATYLYGDITFSNFELTTPGKFVYFETDKTFTFTGNTHIEGTGYNVIKLLSSQEGSQWFINIPDNNYNIVFVGVGDSCNIGAEPIHSDPALSYGRNIGWKLDPYWVGAGADALWSTPANWWPVGVPGLADDVTFDGTDYGVPGASPNKNADVDAGFAGQVNAMTINGYTGTITLQRSLTVNADYSQVSGNIDLNGQLFNVLGDFTLSGGVFTCGNSTWSLSNDVNLGGGTLNADTSTLVKVYPWPYSDLIGGNKTLYNLTINAYTYLTTSNISVSNILSLTQPIEILSGRTLTLNNGATTTFGASGTVTGAGTFQLVDGAGANLDATGVIRCNTRFTSSTASVTIPARYYYSSVELYNASGSDYTFTLGTGAAQSIYFGSLYPLAEGAGNVTVDGATFNPAVTVANDLDFKGTGAGTESLSLGSGTWTIGGNVDLSNGALVCGTSTLDMNASGYSTFGTGANEDVNTMAVYNNELVIGGYFSQINGTAYANIAKWNGSSWSALGTGTSSRVYALCVYNNELYAGGTFWTAGGVAADSIARWNGTNWSAVGTGIQDGYVVSLGVFDGSLIVGGTFTAAGGSAGDRIASWDGATWSALGSGIDGTVNGLCVYNNTLIAAGDFSTAGGVAAVNIAQWDGASWAGMGGTLGGNNDVETCITFNNELYIGGIFTSAGGVAASMIAKWDGANWSAVGTSLNSVVSCLAVYNNELIAGGNFTSSGATTVNYLAKWDGSSWAAIGSGTNGVVYSLAEYNNDLYFGGRFTQAGMPANRIAVIDNQAVLTLNSQTLNNFTASNTWKPDREIVMADTLNIQADLNLSAQSDGDITLDGSTNNPAVNLTGDLDYIGSGSGTESINMGSGTWTVSGNVDLTGGTISAGTSTLAMNGSYVTLTGNNQTFNNVNLTFNLKYISGSDVFISGTLTNAVSILISDSITLNMNPGSITVMSGAGSALQGDGTFNLIDSAGGNINAVGTIKCLTRFTSSSSDVAVSARTYCGPVEFYNTTATSHTFTLGTAGAQTLNFGSFYPVAMGTGNVVIDAATYNPAINIYSDLDFIGTGSGTESISLGSGSWTIGGNADFTGGTITAGTSTLILEPAGWQSLGTGANARIMAFLVYNGNLIVGGDFTAINGVALNHIAGWDGNTWFALGSGISATGVSALANYGGNLIAAGAFSTAGGLTANCIASWNGSAWSNFGTGATNAAITSLAVYGGNLIAAGYFTTICGTAANYIAQWDGIAWSGLGTGMDYYVNELTVYGTDLVAGGDFSNAGGVAASRIARWDGAGWSAFGSGTSGGSNTVYTVAVYDSKLIIGGTFSSVNGVAASSIASWDGMTWSALGSGVGSGAQSLYASGNTLIVGGLFYSAGGVSVNNIAAWNGSSWSALNGGTNERISAISYYNGDLYIGGSFTIADEEASRIAYMPNNATFTSAGQTLNNLTIRNNSEYARQVTPVDSLSVAGNLYLLASDSADITLDCPTFNPGVTVSGNLDFIGAGSGTEILNAGSGTWTLAGNIDFSGGTFNRNTSTFAFNGAGISQINGSNTFYNFSCTTAGKQLTFSEAVTQTITNSFTLTGADGNLVKLRSTTSGNQWLVDPQLTRTISYADVQDSNNINASVINVAHSLDSGNNLNWFFEAESQPEEPPPIEIIVVPPPPPPLPPVEVPPVEVPPVEVPPVETPPVETPPAETPSAENPAAETPPADETAPDEAAPAETPASSDTDTSASAEDHGEHGFDLSSAEYEEGEKRFKKPYLAGKYKTSVILFEGKVIVSPYDRNGLQEDKKVVLLPGQSTAQSAEVK